MAKGTATSDRLIGIVSLFVDHGSLTLTQVADHAQLDLATASRYLRRLEEHRWLERDPKTKAYLLGTGLITLGRRAIEAQPLRKLLLAGMRELADAFNETVNLAAYRSNEVIIIDCVEAQRSIRRGATVGDRDHLVASSLGKAILSHLPDETIDRLFAEDPRIPFTENTIVDGARFRHEIAVVRQRGYAIDAEEAEIGMKCAGVAILDADGYPSHAISVCGPAHRMTDETIELVGSMLVSIAAQHPGHPPSVPDRLPTPSTRLVTV